MEHIWESENFEIGRNFDNLVRKLIKRKDEDEWREEMNKKRKLRLYSRIKTRLQLEDYVVELDREKRRQLTMIRGGTNYLRIETGRWVGEREPERLCKMCLCEEVERKTLSISMSHIENMDDEWQLNILIGVGWKEKGKQVREIVVDYLRKANEIRKKYI